MRKVAIIGSGISGLTCGYHLSKKNNIVIFEAEDYIGGHTHTVKVNKNDEAAEIDTGFIVFNDRTYPNFIKLMETVGVEYQPTEMSFSVRNDAINLEYNGNSIASLFAQRRNLVRPHFLKMLFDITRFNREVLAEKNSENDATIGSYLEKNRYSDLFRENYLLPMISAIWSMGKQSCLDFPLRFFVRFFKNHGLLSLNNRPQWYTIKGGSSSYIAPLTNGFNHKIRTSSPVQSVIREKEGVRVATAQYSELFDEVVFACHGDQVLHMLENPLPVEKRVLSSFPFSRNYVVLHTDIDQLPKRKKAWASWNYRMVDAAKEQTTLTYNMNILQRLKKRQTYLVSLNQEIDKRHILGEYDYSHPVYSPETIKAQEQWHTVSGVDNIHYCGAYWFNGFHEDGVKSAMRVCNMIEKEETCEMAST